MEKERIALGIRNPHKQEIEFAMLRSGNPDNLLPELKRQYEVLPQRLFGEMAGHRRLMVARDAVEFHDVARQAGAQRWYVHQLAGWRGDLVRPKSSQSLLSRWFYHVERNGGGRFVPGNYLGRIGTDGIRRNCIMGMAMELFLDDYPGAIEVRERISAAERLELEWDDEVGIDYITFDPADQDRVLPYIVQRELGLADHRGAFQLTPGVRLALEQGYGVRMSDFNLHFGIPNDDWSLVNLNDHARNWPTSALIIEEPTSLIVVPGTAR